MLKTFRNVSKNRLLAALPQEDLERLNSNLQRVSLTMRQVLNEPGARINHVYFVEQGVASVLTNMANGATIEVGMIGIEGMVGVPALLGAELSAQLVIVQSPGAALRMDAARCKRPRASATNSTTTGWIDCSEERPERPTFGKKL
jgi:CRP-like cAMP-binding protein